MHLLWEAHTYNSALTERVLGEAHTYNPALTEHVLQRYTPIMSALMVQLLWEAQTYKTSVGVHILWKCMPWTQLSWFKYSGRHTPLTQNACMKVLCGTLNSKPALILHLLCSGPRNLPKTKNQQGDRVLYVKAKNLYFIQVCKLGLSVCPMYWSNQRTLSSVRVGFL